MTRSKESTAGTRAEFFEALKERLSWGALVLLIILPLLLMGGCLPLQSPGSGVRANFGAHRPSPDARSVADWVMDSRDHKKMSFIIVDKKDARVYVFNPSGQLKDASVALLGSAPGDDSVPGIGDKPLSQVLPQERTTPAGRFIAQLGMNTKGEDIIWVDYAAAVSMHRVRTNVPSEQRLERLASPTLDDNRISFGCINLPPEFYDKTLKPTVQAGATVIYVLPETRRLDKTFASYYDVNARLGLVPR